MSASQFAFGLSVLPVAVTDRDIDNGVSRDCTGCAIARALNRTLPRLGFKDCYVRLTPYAAFGDAPGLEIFQDFPHKQVGSIAPEDLPHGLIEWAIDFDEWKEFDDYGSVKAWREGENKSVRDYGVPCRPEPVTFVFNFGKLQPARQ